MTKSGSDPDRNSGQPRDDFTDRESHLDVFRRALSAPEGETLPVLALHGVGGRGKTRLIDKMTEVLDRLEPPVPHARFDIENVKTPAAAAREVLLRLRSDLESRFRLKFPRFDLLLTVLIAREGGTPPSLVTLNPHLKSTFDFMMGLLSIPSDMIGKFLLGQAGKSETAERLLARAGGREEILHLRERARRDDPTLADELIDRFAADLVEGLPRRPGHACRGVLFFDTFETLWKGSDAGRSVQARRLDAWLRQLAKAVRSRGVLVVVAGRDELRWADDDRDWADALETHLLGGFSRHDAQIYLARRGIGPQPWAPETPLQTAILDTCAEGRGTDGEESYLPFYLARCADIVENHRDQNAGADPPPGTFLGVPGDRVAQALTDLFLKSLPSEQWELWVRELSLTPSFDERAALELDRDRHHNLGQAGWKQLCRYSFLEPQPEGHYRLHKTMRDVLRFSLDDDGIAVHTWFLNHWTGRAEPALAFFHQWCLEPEPALDEWLAEHASALKDRRINAARRLLDDWSEISLDGLDHQHLTAPLWAKIHGFLGRATWETPMAPRAPSLNAAIDHLEAALEVYTEAEFPAQWATTQTNLGLAYGDLPTCALGERLGRAIACFKSALRVYTKADLPLDWAMVQNNLGVAYHYLRTGDHDTNNRQAIICYRSALRVYTEAESPLDRAMVRNNLGVAYQSLSKGNRGKNLRRAIACFKLALRVYTEAEFPTQWATTLNNLGIAYRNLPTGERDKNLRRAIACYESALRVRTEEDFPSDWAMTQANLGNAYGNLPTGDLRRDFGRAIACYELALRVYTESEFPSDWAMTQYNLGNAYHKLSMSDLGENLGRAIACYEATRRIWTEADFPSDWSRTEYNLGLALRANRNLDESAQAFESAARGYRRVGDLVKAGEAKGQAEQSRRMMDPQTDS